MLTVLFAGCSFDAMTGRRLRRIIAVGIGILVVLGLLPSPAPRQQENGAAEGYDGFTAPVIRPAQAPQPRVLDDRAFSRGETEPKSHVWPAPKRVAELTQKRSANGTVFQLEDGRLQREISTVPLHYRGADGGWHAIDTKPKPTGKQGFRFANESNTFRSYFGDSEVRFEFDGAALTLGVSGEPTVDRGTVRYPLDGAELRYEIRPDALSEKIVLASPPDKGVSYKFSISVEGLRAEPRADGAIDFFREDARILLLPKAFAFDAADAYTGAVKQTVSQQGNRLTVTLTPDERWLLDPKRRYPVIIDPTLKIAPTPTQSQDTMVLSDSPDTNFDDSWRLSVGTTATGVSRSLLKFPMSGISSGTRIDSAQLQLYYDQNHTSNASAVTLEARRATGAWTETGATWNNSTNLVGELGFNSAQVDDGDFWQHSFTGSWPYSTAADRSHAVNTDYVVNKNSTAGETYTWYPILTEPGTYRVEAHYVSGADRATNAPYTISFNGGTQTYAVNQSAAGSAGVWKTLGSHSFVAGTVGKITLGDVGDASKAVVGDAVRFTKDATVVRPAGDQASHWHSFSVRSIVQSWLDGTQQNHGFVVKAANESALGAGGPRYEGSIYAYNGETAIYPRLVVTYGRPGVEVDSPTTIHATGAQLTWPSYVDPCSFCWQDDIVEYQVHRSVWQTFTPSAATLVAPVAAARNTYTDTTAIPTPADVDEATLGNAYYYMVAVKTKDGGVTAGPTQIARLPKAGRVTRIYQAGTVDTTLSSLKPTTNLDRVDGQPWLSVGNNSSSYGTTRSVVKFPAMTDIPTNARVIKAEAKMWVAGVNGDPNATWELRALTADFNETTATWNSWTTPGGDFASGVFGTDSNVTNDPRRRNFNLTPLAQWWVAAPSTNKGVLLKLANEATPASRAVYVSSEADEPQLTPQLVVTYLEKKPESTYYVPDTPPAVVANSTTAVPVTVTNTTDAALSRTQWVMSYRWTRPDGSTVIAPHVETSLPADIPVNESLTFQAQVAAPGLSVEEGNRRTDHVLSWDLLNKSNGKWLSNGGSSTTVGALTQPMAVEDATSDQVGLEKFYAYSGRATGAGSGLVNNLHAGNAVWSYDAFANPSRGLSTFVRLAYNSKDTSDSVTGFGWSLQASSLMRLGTPIDPHPNSQGRTVSLTDGDGTTHTFTLDANGVYQSPAGVHLFLQRVVQCQPKDEITQAWKMTAPSRLEFSFDCQGYLSSIVDKNGNRMEFTYEVRKSQNKPTKFLRYITDATGRQTLTIDYWAKGDSYSYIDDVNWTKLNGTNLTNPFIIDHVRKITDITGRELNFTYTPKGLLGELMDNSKKFSFRYDMTQGNKNVKLVRITDPVGNYTMVDYYSRPEDDPKFKWSTKTITDRMGFVTSFAYSDPDGQAGQQIQTVVTDQEGRPATYLMDGKGRPLQLRNAKGEVTKLAWDAENNVNRMDEANGAFTTWTYDPKTGYPTLIKDAEANRNNTAGTTLTYQTGLGGRTADLIAKVSPEGRTWTFTYTGEGDLATVTDPIGNTTPTAGDYTTAYTYDTHGQLLTVRDANGNVTTHSEFEPTGYPKKITDALGNPTSFGYDLRGNVVSVTDPLGNTVTQDYDAFGRPTQSKVPKDRVANLFITTPAPLYDANDNILKSTLPNGAFAEAVFDKNDRVSYVLAPRDTPTGPQRKTSFTYNRVGVPLTETDPNGNTTTATYDEIHRLSAVVDAKGNRWTMFHDNVGNVTKTVDARKNATADPNDFTAQFWYDLNHRVRARFDAAGKVEITDYDKDGIVVAQTDRAGNQSLAISDARGMPVEIRVPRSNDGGTVSYNTTRFEYDQVGNRTKVISPRGVATPAVADDFVHQTVYDKLNRIKEELSPFDPMDARYNKPDKTSRTYDTAGRLIALTLPPSAGQTLLNETKYTYFDNGWVRTTTDPWDIVTAYEYNEIGRQFATVVAPGSGSTSRWMISEFYPDGKLKSRNDLGVPVGNRVVVVDNSETNNASFTGTWSGFPGGGARGPDYRTHAAGAGTDKFEWDLQIPQDGNYDVFVYYPAVSGAAPNATFRITYAGGAFVDKPVDQTKNTGTWVNLGRYPFTAGSPAKVGLTQSANGVVVADAVKLVRGNAGETDNETHSFGYQYDPAGNMVSLTDSSPGRRVDSYAVTYDQLNQVARVQESFGGATRNTTSFTYNEIGALTTSTHDKEFAKYEYDPRDLLAKVTTGISASDPAPKVSTFTYTDKGERLRQVKGNGNTVDHTYFLDSLLRTQVEKTPGGVVVSEHTMSYDPNGNRAGDTARVMNAENHLAYLSTTSTITYDPRDRVVRVAKTGVGADIEEYVNDANSNVISQKVKNVTTAFNYDRNRLMTSVSGGVTARYNYDLYGRLDTTVSNGVVRDRRLYDGFDHVVEQRTLVNGATSLTRYSYDPLDRTTSKTTDAGTQNEKTTIYNYLGLSGEVLDEEVAGRITKSYQYSPWGERLSQVTHNETGTKESAFFGYNPHTDVEQLTDASGNTKATYGYTAYGKNDDARFTGVDKPDAANPTKEPYNPYRFNAKRWDQASGDYDMGFRDYSPGLNRFLTRDVYNGALNDLSLSVNPFTSNRYAFAGGNPISRIEYDGHINDLGGGGGGGGGDCHDIDCVRAHRYDDQVPSDCQPGGELYNHPTCGRTTGGQSGGSPLPQGRPVFDFENRRCLENCDEFNDAVREDFHNCVDSFTTQFWGHLTGDWSRCSIEQSQDKLFREAEGRRDEAFDDNPWAEDLIELSENALFIIDAAGQVRVFTKGGLEIPKHAGQRMVQRNVTLDMVDDITTRVQPFDYFHNGVWKKGYFDAAENVFIGTVDDKVVTTVIRNPGPNYINNLLAKTPPGGPPP